MLKKIIILIKFLIKNDKVFDKESYRRLYREYLNIKNDIERKPEDNIQQGI